MDLSDPTAATLAVVKALRAAGIRQAVYGGLALAASLFRLLREPKRLEVGSIPISSTITTPDVNRQMLR